MRVADTKQQADLVINTGISHPFIILFDADQSTPLSSCLTLTSQMLARQSKMHCTVLLSLTKVMLQAFQCTCRWEKSAAEVDLMQASASATAAAMKECIQLSRPSVQEAQLAAVFGKAQEH